MLNYQDEIKNAILEVLKEDKKAKNILQSEESKDTIIENLVDYLWAYDYVTGNASGSYYFNTVKSRLHCYNYASDVREALEEFGDKEKLEMFKIFEALADENYLHVNTMVLNYNLINETLNEDDVIEIYYKYEQIEELDFEALDVITRCCMLYEVVSKVVESILKYQVK